MVTGGIDWDTLGVPEYENPHETMERLKLLHMQILEQNGIAYEPGKNSPGFEPTATQARQVAVMASLGLSKKDIALVLNIEEKLLALYYKRELTVANNLANAMVARVALQMALSGQSADMTKFWLKTQAKWRETQNINLEANLKTEDVGASAKDRLKQRLDQAAAAGVTGVAPAKQG